MKISERLKRAGKKQKEDGGAAPLRVADKSGKRPSRTLHMLKKRKWLWIILLVIVIAAGIMGWRYYSSRQAAARMREAMSTVETTQVVKQNLVDSISVTGTIASADAWDVSASAKDVEVLQVNCEAGDYVNKGDVIVVLDSSDLELSLTQAQNSQTLSEYKESKSIESASDTYAEAVEDGTDEYTKAQKTADEAKEDLQEAEDELAGAASALERQEERLGEAEEALAAVSAEDYETTGEYEQAYAEAENNLSQVQAEYTARHQAYETAADAEEKAVEVYEDAVEALETAEKNNTKNVNNAADTLEQAQMEHTYSNDSSSQTIENLQDQIESCTVTAPISGIITAMNVSVGDTYQGEGNTLFSVADNEHFIVSANVDEYDISSISKDMTAAVIVEAIGDDELPAKVSFVSPTVTSSNTGNSTYAIEIALDDANTDLRIGMTAKASIVLQSANDVLTVPYDCIEADEDGNSTIYIDRDGEKTQVPVTVGMQGDYYVEVSGDDLDENTIVYYSVPMTNSDASSGDSGDGEMMITPSEGGNGGGGGNPGGGGGRGGGPGGGF